MIHIDRHGTHYFCECARCGEPVEVGEHVWEDEDATVVCQACSTIFQRQHDLHLARRATHKGG